MIEAEDCKDRIVCFLCATIYKKMIKTNKVKDCNKESDALG